MRAVPVSLVGLGIVQPSGHWYVAPETAPVLSRKLRHSSVWKGACWLRVVPRPPKVSREFGEDDCAMLVYKFH